MTIKDVGTTTRSVRLNSLDLGEIINNDEAPFKDEGESRYHPNTITQKNNIAQYKLVSYLFLSVWTSSKWSPLSRSTSLRLLILPITSSQRLGSGVPRCSLLPQGECAVEVSPRTHSPTPSRHTHIDGPSVREVFRWSSICFQPLSGISKRYTNKRLRMGLRSSQRKKRNQCRGEWRTGSHNPLQARVPVAMSRHPGKLISFV